MREIKFITLHCTATLQNATVQAIQNYWKQVEGWNNPGYHFLIEPNGTVHNLQPIEKPSNGVLGFNQNNINISYIGGVLKDLTPIDNRTPEQLAAMIKLVKDLKAKFPKAEVLGHRDFYLKYKSAPNNKACPCFDAATWCRSIGVDPNPSV